MNVAEQRQLSEVPIPVEDGYPVCVMVTGHNGVFRTCWGMSGCRKPEPFGPAYQSAKDACAASRYINERGAA